jgi:hypothetical protein
VLLAPPFDTKEKDLGGAIIGDDETLPAGATNLLARAKAAGKDKKGKSRSQPGADKMRPLPVVADAGSRSRAVDPHAVKGPDNTRTAFGGNWTNQAALLKQFDKDGDGKLNAAEEAAKQRWLARQRGTNAPRSGPVIN